MRGVQQPGQSARQSLQLSVLGLSRLPGGTRSVTFNFVTESSLELKLIIKLADPDADT